MKIMGIDSDGAFGWALYDDDLPPSAIVSGSLNLTGDDTMEKLIELRVRFVPIVKELNPDFAAVEQPVQYLPKYPVNKDEEASQDLISRLDRAKAATEGTGKVEWRDQNTAGIAVTNQIAGAASVLLLCWNVRCIQVPAAKWRTIIPATIKAQFATKDPKKKKEAAKKAVKSYCDVLRIQSPNQSSRDACLIALWAAGRAQELKMIARAREAS